MKIEEILQKDDYFYVTLKMSWWERMIGLEDRIRIYKQIGQVNELHHSCTYIDKNGDRLSPLSPIGAAIDRFKLKRLFGNKDDIQISMN